MDPNMQNQAMAQAMGGGGAAPGGAPGGPAPMGSGASAGPQIPPELIALAAEMGLDIRDPQQLMILIQMISQGGGGPMGPMAGPGGGGAPQMAPGGPPQQPMM